MTTISRDRFLKKYVGFVFFFAVLSSFNVLPFLAADIQPWVVLLALPMVLSSIVLFKNEYGFEAFVALFIVLLIPYTAIGVVKYGLGSAVNFFLYICGPVFLLFFHKYSPHVNVFKTLRIFAWLFLLVGLFEVLVPNGLAIKLEPYSSAMVKRLWLVDYDESRGISLLFSEPSHAARAIWILTLLFAMSFNRMTNAQQLGYGAILCFLIITNGSATVYALIVMTAVVYSGFNAREKVKWIFRLLILVTGVVLLIYIMILFDAGRIADIYKRLSVTAEGGLSVEILKVFGGIRLVSEYAALKIFLVNPFGLGVGSSQFETLPMLTSMGIDETNNWFIRTLYEWYDRDTLKPSSYFTQMLVDVGILGVMLFLYLFVRLFRVVVRKPLYLAFAVVALLQLLFLSTTSIPAPWVVLGLVSGWSSSRGSALMRTGT